jgi:hypothetical protein
MGSSTLLIFDLSMNSSNDGKVGGALYSQAASDDGSQRVWKGGCLEGLWQVGRKKIGWQPSNPVKSHGSREPLQPALSRNRLRFQVALRQGAEPVEPLGSQDTGQTMPLLFVSKLTDLPDPLANVSPYLVVQPLLLDQSNDLGDELSFV